MRRQTSTLIVVLLVAAWGRAAAQPPAAVPAPPTPVQAPQKPKPPASSTEPARNRFEPYVSLTSAFDTNLEHDRADTDSFGGVLGAGFIFRNNPVDPTMEITGEVAGHEWTNSSRWDRFSQKLTASYERNLPGRWRADAAGEISLKGSTEDREISDQYSFVPRLSYRLTSQNRVRVYLGLRARRYDEDPDRNAFNRYLGVEFTERAAADRRMEVDLRYEVNHTRSPRHHYNRWTLGLGYSLPVAGDRVEAEVRYRMQYYPFRLVEVDDIDVNRRDHRWIPKVAWIHPVSSNLDLRAGYTFETRTSNNLDREFSAHLFSLTLVRRW